VSLDPQLVEILACPDTHHTPLDYDPAAETLTCQRCGRIFAVRDGIPVLLLDDSDPDRVETRHHVDRRTGADREGQ
jgi:uncharacterized protein YbaR (Trm112 family)